MRVARHGADEASHAVTLYSVTENAGGKFAWLTMKPVTGRTHQLRAHAAHIGHPIIGDDKYFKAEDEWNFPGGLQNKLHLHARRIVIPHPSERRHRRDRAAAAAHAAELEPDGARCLSRRCAGRGRGVRRPAAARLTPRARTLQHAAVKRTSSPCTKGANPARTAADHAGARRLVGVAKRHPRPDRAG